MAAFTWRGATRPEAGIIDERWEGGGGETIARRGGREIHDGHDRPGESRLFPESWCYPLRASRVASSCSFLSLYATSGLYLSETYVFFLPLRVHVVCSPPPPSPVDRRNWSRKVLGPPRVIPSGPLPSRLIPLGDSRVSCLRVLSIFYADQCHCCQFPAAFAVLPRCQLTAVKLRSSFPPPVAGNLGRAEKENLANCSGYE